MEIISDIQPDQGDWDANPKLCSGNEVGSPVVYGLRTPTGYSPSPSERVRGPAQRGGHPWESLPPPDPQKVDSVIDLSWFRRNRGGALYNPSQFTPRI